MSIEKIRRRMNFRELGGYPTQDGRTVKHGMFYRCGALGELTEDEFEVVESLGLKAVYDFRSNAEAERLPDPVPNGAQYYHLSAAKKLDQDDRKKSDDMSPEAMEKSMMEMMKNPDSDRMFREFMYGDLAFSEAYQVMFDNLRKAEAPIVFHCSAGKDRTGIAAILILLALGVDYETAMSDYEKTNEYRTEQIEALLKKTEHLINGDPVTRKRLLSFEGVNRVNAEYSFEMVLKRYGTYENFFEQHFGLNKEELQKFREMYTER